jgi:polar amino acid transport system substrate-binding protein
MRIHTYIHTYAYVSQSTVGYGDKAPVTFAGRILTIVWMFTAMYCVGLFGASVTVGLVNGSVTSYAFGSTIQKPKDVVGLR